jgi:hypothetical protein
VAEALGNSSLELVDNEDPLMLRGELCVLRGELGWEVGTLRGEPGIDWD